MTTTEEAKQLTMAPERLPPSPCKSCGELIPWPVPFCGEVVCDGCLGLHGVFGKRPDRIWESENAYHGYLKP